MTNLMSVRARRMRRDKEPAERKLWYLLGSPPTPSPAPQGGGESAQRLWSAKRPVFPETDNA
jgi:hypothetical protein